MAPQLRMHSVRVQAAPPRANENPTSRNDKVSQPRTDIYGSTPKQLGAALGPAEPGRTLSITILLRRAPSASNIEKELLAGTFHAVGRENAAAILGADPADVAAVRAFLQQYALKIVAEDVAARTLRAEGTVQQMENAFGVRLMRYQAPDGGEFLSHQGAISIPVALSGIIVAVLGLDQRRIAEPR